MRKILLFSLLLFLFSGCVSKGEWLKTKPLPFQNGYNDGCKNGKDMVDYSYVFKTNNTEKYKTDMIYKDGWDEGYYDCYTDLEMSKMTNTRFGE